MADTKGPTGIVAAPIIADLGLAADASAETVVAEVRRLWRTPSSSLTADEIRSMAKVRKDLNVSADASSDEVIAALSVSLVIAMSASLASARVAAAPSRFSDLVADKIKAGRSLGAAQLDAAADAPEIYAAAVEHRRGVAADTASQQFAARGLMAVGVGRRMAAGESFDQACRGFAGEHPELATQASSSPIERE